MKITGTGPLQSAASLRRKGAGERAGGGAFASALSSEASPQAASAAGEIGGVATLLAIQEVGDPTAERRRAVRRGQDLLERLDELRHGLLMGILPLERIDSLLAMVRQQQERISDPRLREVLREIEVRAAVELAKLGHME